MSLPPVPEPPTERILDWVADSGRAEAEEAVPLTLEALETTTEPAGPPPEGILLEQPVMLEEPVEPLAGLVGRDDRMGEAEHVDLAAEFRVETAEDIILESSGGGEFQVANASEELVSDRGRPEPEPFLPELPVELESPPAAPEPVPPHGPPRWPRLPAGGLDLVVTESMASCSGSRGIRTRRSWCTATSRAGARATPGSRRRSRNSSAPRRPPNRRHRPTPCS
jgi:hypothetical protein